MISSCSTIKIVLFQKKKNYQNCFEIIFILKNGWNLWRTLYYVESKLWSKSLREFSLNGRDIACYMQELEFELQTLQFFIFKMCEL